VLRAQLAVPSPDAHGYSLDKGLIRYKGRLWIADNAALQSKLIATMSGLSSVLCQQAKHEHTNPSGLLQPLPVLEWPWAAIKMDFIEGLPKSDGCEVILVVVDILTKYTHFLPLRHPFTAASVANLFLDSIIKFHGVPLSIVSDHDKVFTSNIWRELLAAVRTKLCYSTAYHPQTDRPI
jgi:hypothetical protein